MPILFNMGMWYTVGNLSISTIMGNYQSSCPPDFGLSAPLILDYGCAVVGTKTENSSSSLTNSHVMMWIWHLVVNSLSHVYFLRYMVIYILILVRCELVSTCTYSTPPHNLTNNIMSLFSNEPLKIWRNNDGWHTIFIGGINTCTFTNEHLNDRH